MNKLSNMLKGLRLGKKDERSEAFKGYDWTMVMNEQLHCASITPSSRSLDGDRGPAEPCYSCSISLLYHFSLWIVTTVNELTNVKLSCS
jgi:hypothetical protein